MKKLEDLGIVPVLSDYIYAGPDGYCGTPRQRAESLMNFYENEEIRAIFDISGGDLANEVLLYLDFEAIAGSDKIFWGYSDLTVILNALFAKTGRASVLYQVRNLVSSRGPIQTQRFQNSVLNGQGVGGRNDLPEESGLFQIPYEWMQGKEMKGTLVGGNIRCLTKLAGTPFWPDMKDKILFLESRSGRVPQMATLLNQLKQMGVFGQIRGLILGTFTQMEKEQCCPTIGELVKRCVGESLPVAVTGEVGHAEQSRALVIGSPVYLCR